MQASCWHFRASTLVTQTAVTIGRWQDVSDNILRQSILHSCQDLRLVALLLANILIMLGIIADWIR